MLRRRRRGHGPDHGLDILSAGSRTAASTGGARAGHATTIMDPVELLATPAISDDLTAQLAARPPRAKLPKLTLALAAAVLIGSSFLGGLTVGKQSASSGSGSAAGAPASGGGLPSGAGGGSFPGAGRGTAVGGLGGGTVGTVKLVNGHTIYVQGFSGTITRVTTSPATKIQVSAAGTLQDLRPGETVIVQGSKRGDGSVAATSVSESGIGSTGGG